MLSVPCTYSKLFINNFLPPFLESTTIDYSNILHTHKEAKEGFGLEQIHNQDSDWQDNLVNQIILLFYTALSIYFHNIYSQTYEKIN